VVEKKEIKVSKTDPDSGYMIRDGKPEGFFYLDHRTVDLKYNLITDVHITPGNVHDSVPYLSRLDRQRERFGFEVEAVAPGFRLFNNPHLQRIAGTGDLWSDCSPEISSDPRLISEVEVYL